MDFNPKHEMLQEAVREAQNIIVFTGAGLSTESGIPDYRSPGGLWSQFEPIQFQDFMASEEVRLEDWRRRFILKDEFGNAQPNKGHEAIVKLHGQGKLLRVITQNIDGMHQRSGVPDDKIIELHGNCTYATCLNCAQVYSLEDCKNRIERDKVSPSCDSCGGLVKTAVINFGQAMPVEEMVQAEKDTNACDLFLVLGSSLQVYPAAALPQIAKRNGAELIIINREATPLDALADLVIHDNLGTTLSVL